MQLNGWDHALEVTADGNGLVGHGGILLRKLADQSGLTAELDSALTKRGTSPQASRGVALVSTAIAIAMGATSMSDIEVLGQLAPVLGPAPSDSTVRWTLNLADDRTLTRIAQARARIRKHVWKQIEDEDGFPWLSAGGKELAGWTVIDMDGTLVVVVGLRRAVRVGFRRHLRRCAQVGEACRAGPVVWDRRRAAPAVQHLRRVRQPRLHYPVQRLHGIHHQLHLRLPQPDGLYLRQLLHKLGALPPQPPVEAPDREKVLRPVPLAPGRRKNIQVPSS
jgi:hypothetical protein